MDNQKAQDAFMEKLAYIKDAVKEIEGYIDEHMNLNPNEINWGHVGNASQIAGQLTEILEFMFPNKAIT